MVVIFKIASIHDALEAAKIRAASRGSKRNVIGVRCISCHLPFETYIKYKKQLCILCRYERCEEKGEAEDYLSALHNVDSKEDLYRKAIAKAILLENNKTRVMKASGCKVSNRAVCERLDDLKGYLDSIE